jgi:hypothetical protein
MPPSNTLQFVIRIHARHGHSINQMDTINEQSLEEWIVKGLEKDTRDGHRP